MSQRALQLQYTSCRRGVRGGKGFQTRAFTVGLRPDEQREIEARSGFSVPRDLPSAPTYEEIDRDFPVAFRGYRLASGRYALTRTCYAGRDYSQRWGNFFSHTLVVDALPPGAYPIDYFEWSGWKSRLEAEEDTEEAPPTLHDIDFDAIEPSPSFTLAELQTFLREAPGRVEVLAAMIRAVFFGGPKSRVLVVRAAPLDAAFWLACVQKAFPPRLACTLSLSTYQFDSRDCAALNGTTTGTGFLFDDTQRRFQFCMFDLVEGKNSEIPDEGGEYAATVARWMADRPDRLASFHAFMAHVDLGAIAAELVQPLRLFRAGAGEGPALPSGQLIESIGFAARHVPSAHRGPLIPVVGHAAVTAANEGQTEQLAPLLKFLGESAAGIPAPERAGVAALWLRCFQALRAAGRYGALTTLSEGRRTLAQNSPEVERAIASQLLSSEELRAIGQWLGALPAAGIRSIEAVVREILDAARSLGEQQPLATPAVRELIAEVSVRARQDREAAGSLLRAFGSDADALTRVCWTLLRGSPGDPSKAEVDRRGEIAGGALADALAGATTEVRAAVRRGLDKPETWHVLLGEWRAMLERRQNLRALYAGYRDAIAKDVPHFDQQHRGDLMRLLAAALNGRERAQQALEWLRSGEVDHRGPDLKSWCITAAAAGIPLTREDPLGRALAREIAERARAEGVTLDPDRPFLRESLDLVHGPVTLGVLKLDRIAAMMDRLDRDDYETFLSGWLQPALQRAHNDTEHGKVLRAAFVPAEQPTFVKAFTRALGAGTPSPLSSAAAEAALQFWLGSLSPGTKDPLKSVHGPALAALTERLAAMERKEFDDLAQRLGASGRINQTTTWNRLCETVAQRNKSVFTRLTDLLLGPKG